MGLLDYLKGKKTEVKDVYDSQPGFIKSGQVHLIDDIEAEMDKMETVRNNKKKKDTTIPEM